MDADLQIWVEGQLQQHGDKTTSQYTMNRTSSGRAIIKALVLKNFCFPLRHEMIFSPTCAKGINCVVHKNLEKSEVQFANFISK